MSNIIRNDLDVSGSKRAKWKWCVRILVGFAAIGSFAALWRAVIPSDDQLRALVRGSGDVRVTRVEIRSSCHRFTCQDSAVCEELASALRSSYVPPDGYRYVRKGVHENGHAKFHWMTLYFKNGRYATVFARFGDECVWISKPVSYFFGGEPNTIWRVEFPAKRSRALQAMIDYFESDVGGGVDGALLIDVNGAVSTSTTWFKRNPERCRCFVSFPVRDE